MSTNTSKFNQSETELTLCRKQESTTENLNDATINTLVKHPEIKENNI